jgi:hypothetical protein
MLLFARCVLNQGRVGLLSSARPFFAHPMVADRGRASPAPFLADQALMNLRASPSPLSG